MFRLPLQLTLLLGIFLCTCASALIVCTVAGPDACLGISAQTVKGPLGPPDISAEAWRPVDLEDVDGDRRVEVARAEYVVIDAETLQKVLFAAPHERDVAAKASSTRITLPLPGAPATFRIVGYDISEPAGLAKFPDMRTFYGVDERNPERTVFLDWTVRGFHASVRGGGREAVFIDPLFRGQTDLYQVYRKNDYDADQIEPFTCHTTEADGHDIVAEQTGAPKSFGDCVLRQYRFTTTATGEYSNYHGATSAADVALVQAAVITTTNRVNQIFTRDVSVRFQLVGNNDLLYYYDGGSDPFSGGNADFRNQNTPVVNGIIGFDNYDYGHLVHGSGGGGISFFNAPCTSNQNNKARCFTSANTPEGDFFDVDYVAHEIGHSFNGSHTQNNNCQRDGSGSVEPGSGSTIMSYAGICSPNVQNAVSDYFHGRSIEQMTILVELAEGGGCATIIDQSLNNPVVDPVTDHLIPQGTPFRLEATATGNGTLTYNWEQIDRDPGATMPPAASNAAGPMFRSFPARATGERDFPEFSATLAATDPEWEELPETARDLTFRMTALNTNAAYGCAQTRDLTISVLDEPGSFAVTLPAENELVSGGSVFTVNWTTGGTELAPLLEDRIDVLYSADDGQTWSDLLLNTANSGSVDVTAPGGAATSTARIMLRSRKSVYYAVSRPFEVSGGTAPAIVPVTEQTYVDCAPPQAYTWDFNTNPQNGNTDPVTWSVTTQLPNNVAASFSQNPVTPGGRFAFTLAGLPFLGSGEFTFDLQGVSSVGTVTTSVTVDTRGTRAASPFLASPTQGSTTDLRPVVELQLAAGTTAQVDFSSDPGFGTIDFTTTITNNQPFQITEYLSGDRTYYMRAQAFDSDNTCGPSPFATSVFTTRDDCVLVSSEGNSVLIDNDLPAAEVSLDLPAVTITDLDVAAMELDHTFLGDLTVDLIAPGGSSLNLFNRACGSTDNIDVHMDDEAAAGDLPCPPVGGGFFRPPGDALSQFDGTEAEGTWRLRVTDFEGGDEGFLKAFALRVCGARALPVSWLDFTAAGKKDHIALNWATAAETDNAGFFVERQTNATGAWAELSFVGADAGPGPVTERRYTFNDRTARPNTDYLYRLRQTDRDGTTSYSPIATARYGVSTLIVELFPNPTGGDLNYRLNGSDEPQPYQLHDARGRLLRTGTLHPEGGRIDLTELSNGIYLLKAGERTLRVVRL